MDLARKLAPANRLKSAARKRTREVATLRAATMLAIVLGDGNTPPTEFRLFVSGWNDTENGRYLFDAAAAASVMAAYAKWGVDLMIDLEHQSLDPNTPPEATAKDARGWCKLELRPDGSLWAVSVTWTPDGAARLTDKRQRYISPAFGVDPETSRVTSIINVAITSIPATHDTPALVAASITGGSMDPKLIADALDAITAGDDAKCAEILKGLIASAAGAEVAEPAAELAEDPAMNAADPAPAEPDATDPKKNKEMMAAARVALALTGASDPGEAMAILTRSHKTAVEIDARVAKLEADKKTLEASEYVSLTASMVKLGRMEPFEAWEPGQEGKIPAARVLAEPLVEYRARHAKLAALGSIRGKSPVAPIAGTSGGLTAQENAMCLSMSKKSGKPLVEVTASYVATKAAIAARSNAPQAQET